MNVTDQLAEIDYARDGYQQGFVRIAHSVHRSAYGWIPLPVVQIKNGNGPVVLVMAGVHGDEYEGQLAIGKLIRNLSVEDVTGTLLLLPQANYPAAIAGLRTSPIDDGNLNRAFPGSTNAGPTAAIAHFIESELMPRVDVAIDLHSGGSSLAHAPTAFVDPGSDSENTESAIDIINAFGLPYAALYDRQHYPNHTCGAALRNGVMSIGAELGGCGTLTRHTQQLADDGLRRVLVLIKCLKASMLPSTPASPSQIVDTNGEDLMYSYAEGVFEPAAEPGDSVSSEQIAGRIHTPEVPWQDPIEIRFKRDAVVLARRHPARVQRGDCLYQLGRPR